MKKILNRILVILLVIFSFFYTDKIITFLKQYDPIMKQIKETSKKYHVESINAQIIGNSMISGKNGQDIDYDKSFDKMKNYGTYNEFLTVLKEIKPPISINDNYDKYIIRGNPNNKNIALIFKINKDTNPQKILGIINTKKIPVTLFVDGLYLEKHTNLIKKLNNYEIELLSYDSKYEEPFFKTSLSYLEAITKKTTKYCYTEQDNEELLNMCKKLKLHTIKPTIILNKNIYKETKKNLNNSIIISLEVNNYVEKELSSTIDYISSKGYKFVSLNDLISEGN
ncbi:MAG: hypothetical protein IJI22_05565 [Bacilli bacterium]|nr:hypothetical protein [Bacilli bacterium]